MSGRLRSWSLVGVGLIAGVSISYGVTAYAFRETRSPIPVEEIREFSDVFGAIKANYVEPVEDKKLMQEAITGMLAGLDPHSAFLDGESYRDLQIGTQGEFGGLGIEVGSEDGAIKVIAPIDDTPAARAGNRAGDLIIKIDDKLTRGMNLGDAIKLMRGKPQTPIELTLARKGEAQPIEVKIIRDIIRVQSVKAHIIEPGYGFVRISQFQDRTTEDLVKQINDMYKAGPLKGLVLDLRNDPGGVLNGAVGVAAVFLPPDATVVTTEGRTEDAHRRFAAQPSDYLRGGGDDPLASLPPGIKTVPMVVLVNGASASASEIVAGALQDLKRAELIGTQTFGKGSVQSVIQIRNDRENPAAIKLTTARYFTPSGRSIQAKGIVPDLLVEDTPEGNFAGFSVREADLANHLSNPTVPATPAEPEEKADKSRDAEKGAEHAPIAARRYEFGSADDYQVKQAMNFLKGTPVEVAKQHDKVAAAEETKAEAAKPASAKH
jgi:carboxyl-terminal processing protease